MKRHFLTVNSRSLEVNTQSTNDTSVRLVTTKQWEFEQTRHRGVNPTSSLSTSEDNNNGVGVKADTLCHHHHAVCCEATKTASIT